MLPGSRQAAKSRVVPGQRGKAARKMPRYEEIAADIKRRIQQGEYSGQKALPAIRSLARTYACSKSTAERVYEKLRREDLVYAVDKSGYFVVEKNLWTEGQIPWRDFVSSAPDAESFPYQEIRQCMHAAMKRYQRTLFNYADPQGLLELRQAVSKHLEDHQVFAHPRQIVITGGMQQALYILCQLALQSESPRILVEQPAYGGFLQIVQALGLRADGFERTAEGLDFTALEAELAKEPVSFIYSNPRLQHPLGSTLSKEQRCHLTRLAEKYQTYLVEDDCLADLDSQRKNTPLYYEDMNGRVIYLKSFSKTLLPGLRIGAAVLPPALLPRFFSLRRWLDLGASTLSQGTLCIYLKNGMLETHRKMLQGICQDKMALLRRQQELLGACPGKWQIPPDGFFVSFSPEHPFAEADLLKKMKAQGFLLGSIRENYLPSYPAKALLKISLSKASANDIEAMAGTLAAFLKKARG